MPPKEQVNKTSPFDQNPYKHGDDVLLISNYKQPQNGYFPHAKEDELYNFLLNTMEEAASGVAKNHSDVALVAPMPGRMYFTNNTLMAGDNPTIKYTLSHEKLIRSMSSSSTTSSFKLTNLDDEVDVDAYDEICRWITDQSKYILKSANDFMTKNPDIAVKIMIPVLKRTAGDITLTQADLVANNPKPEATPASSINKSTITIDFTRQWTDIFSTEDKVSQLAYNLAYYRKGQTVFNQDPVNHNISDLNEKSKELEERHIDLAKLPAFTEENIMLLCEYHKIPYEDYQTSDGKTHLGVKTALAVEELKQIDDITAKLAFIDHCLIAFENFKGSKNGLTAGNKKNAKIFGKDAAGEMLPTNSFFKNNVFFMMLEMPLLILQSKKVNPDTPTYPRTIYNQDPAANYNLQRITSLSVRLKQDPVNFHQPQVNNKISNLPKYFHQFKSKSEANDISNSQRRNSETSQTSNMSVTDDEPNPVNLISVKSDNAIGYWATIIQTQAQSDSQPNNKDTHPNDNSSTGDALAAAFTTQVNEIINQICKPDGVYNVILAMDFLTVVLEWYIYTLHSSSVQKNEEKKTAQSLDTSFWKDIKNIAERMQKQIQEEENKLLPSADAKTPVITPYIEYLMNISKTVVIRDENKEDFGPYTSRKDLNLWKSTVTQTKEYKPNETVLKHKDNATPPDSKTQLPAYNAAKSNAFLKFTSFAVASGEGINDKLSELVATTTKFSTALVGDKNTQIRKPNYSR